MNGFKLMRINVSGIFGSGSLSAGPMIGGSSGLNSMSATGSMPVQNEPFILQKPPFGTKRGKRWTSS